ncbi:hypothetical protein [Halothiobacillus sp. DCM-1]|uniref:hypothetical protein n=1 Tax=Halothiobacillus sp. DCM-1 TaxID=3112558 RepID=UPI0032539E80
MKTRRLSLAAGSALAASLAAGAALAAPTAANPFASQQTTATPTVVADMACGAGGCGGNMKKKSDQTEQKDQSKS